MPNIFGLTLELLRFSIYNGAKAVAVHAPIRISTLQSPICIIEVV